MSAVPLECLNDDSDIECSRGGREVLLYKKFLGMAIFFISCLVVVINMLMIIYSVLVQKKKSDRYRTRSSQRTILPVWFLRVTSCFRNMFACKCTIWGKKNDNKDKMAQTNTASAKDAVVRMNTGSTYRDDIVSAQNQDSHLPSLTECLKPIEILPTAERRRGKYSQVKFKDGEQTNGPSVNASNSSSALSTSGTGTDPDKSHATKVPASIKREPLIAAKATTPLVAQGRDGLSDELSDGSSNKVRAAPSRSGTGTDPYKFNAAKVRASIKRESLIAPKAASSQLVQEEIDIEEQANPCHEPQNNTLSTPGEDRDRDESNSRPNNSEAVEKEVITQALLYMGCFLLTYILTIVRGLMGMKGQEPPFLLIFLAQFFLPLQGFFNILVYTRPHIISLRRRNPEYSWFKAFIIVFKAGGDNDSVGQSQRSNQYQLPATDSDIKRRQENIKRDWNRRMSEIKRKSMVSENFLAATRRAVDELGLVEEDVPIMVENGSHGIRDGGSGGSIMIDLLALTTRSQV